VATLTDRLGRCDAAIRERLDADETVIATGRCEDITECGSIDSGGAGWTYMMVTDRRLHWVPYVNLAYAATLDLDAIIRVGEASRAHRYAVTLDHAPFARLRHVPAHRVLIWEWGNAERRDLFDRTRLAFSRKDTQAALALRDQLTRRGLLRWT
jgi:hypothetical protein